MLKNALFIMIFALFISPFYVQAQEELAFSRVEVNLWPEFDRPSMLIIYHLTLPAQTRLPEEIQLRIPSEAGPPNAVAARQPDGTLINLPFEQQLIGEWSRLTFNATTPEIQVEYYDPSLSKDGTARRFEYRWLGDFSVESFTIRVQQPIGASEMRLSPSLGPGQQAADGLVYYSEDLGSLAMGQSFTIVLEYQKATDSLSAEDVPVEASGPLDTTTPGRQSMMSALPWLFGLLGFVLIAGGAIWYWQSGRKSVLTAKSEVPRRRKSSRPTQLEDQESENVYCHNCGKRALPGDRFCRACGSQLRTG